VSACLCVCVRVSVSMSVSVILYAFVQGGGEALWMHVHVLNAPDEKILKIRFLVIYIVNLVAI